VSKNVKGWLLLVFVFVAVPIAALAVLWKDACVTSQVAESQSPDGAFAATVHLTDCKGRLKPATEVRVEARRTPVATKVVEQVLLYQGAEQPELLWKSDGTLRVNYPKGAEIVARKPDYPGLAVEIGEKSS
jgi:hypothetical protein